MRDPKTIYRRFLRARAAAHAPHSPVRSHDPHDPHDPKAQTARAWERALAWVLGIDTDLQERPKEFTGLEPDDVSAAVSLWRVDFGGEDDGQTDEGVPFADRLSEQTWWLLEFPPCDHPDGTRTELWSAFLSDEQYRQLCQCVDATRALMAKPNAKPNGQAQLAQNGGRA